MDHSSETGPKPAAQSMPELEALCPEHGNYTSFNVPRTAFWSPCPGCSKAERARIEAEREANAASESAARHRMAIESAQIPARFIGRTFENFVCSTDAQRSALATARDFAENFGERASKGQGLILSGMPGTGKSHLAAAVLQSIITRDVRYLTCMDLIRAVRETWRRDSEKTETQVLRYLERLDLLVIDEVGVQYGTDGEQTILFDVLDRRYREVRPTILLTNQDKEGLKKFIGDRTFDRLAETCRWVPFDWSSYRPTARKEAA